MPDPMTSTYDRVEVITSVQRRRRWTTEEELRIVEETHLPGNTVSLVARRHGIAGNQLFAWRRCKRRSYPGPPADCVMAVSREQPMGT